MIKNIFEKVINALMFNQGYILILKGIGNTLLITSSALIIGVFLGFLISISKYYKDNKVLNCFGKFSNIYLALIRGTPVLIQLLIMYNVIFASVTSKKATILVGILTFGLNSGAYVSEIVRAGLESVDIGQREASLALGLSEVKTMLFIIFPQALRNMLPTLFNEFIQLVKETSVLGYIGVIDLTHAGDIIKSQTYEPVGPLIIIAIVYFIIVFGLSRLLNFLEKRVKLNDKNKSSI